MRVLVVGAGATGGAFGTRLQEAGRDVTYLVRPLREEVLRRDGLRFIGPDGERIHQVATVSSIPEKEHYDLVIVAVKAPALPAVLESMAPAIGPDTLILPFLNGFDHIDLLESRYPGQVLGGLVRIVATVDTSGAVVQMTPLSTMTIGTLNGSPLPAEVRNTLDVPGIDLTIADDVVQRLWEKWAFIASAGVVTCLFRNDVGAILEAGGETYIRDAIAETEAVAGAAGYPVGTASHEQSVQFLIAPGSSFTSSLYRDLQSGQALEAEHILGSMAERADALNVAVPLLKLALVQIRAHNMRAK